MSGKLTGLSNFSGATLNLLGAFVSLLCNSSFDTGHDEYTQKKLIHYQVLVRRTSLFSLAIIGEIYHDHENGSNWANLLAFNIIDKCGDLEIGFEKHLTEFLKNTSINLDQNRLIEKNSNLADKNKIS